MNQTKTQCLECPKYHRYTQQCTTCGAKPRLRVQTREGWEKDSRENYLYFKENNESNAKKHEREIIDLRNKLGTIRQRLQKAKKLAKQTYKEFVIGKSYEAYVRKNREMAKRDGFKFIENKDSEKVNL